MAILNIRPVESGQSKAVLGIAGISGDGKTYTALLIARGMVNKASEIGFLDTENRRGSLYADILDGQFMIGDLYPPFSPNRYADAIKEFQEAGVKVLVIDSVTHEWEGDGGCDDIANGPKADGTPRKVANWIGAKREHKKFMNVLLQSNMDIICCIRAREKTDFKDPTKPVSLGILPICEKNFMFELTASIMMGNQGKTQRQLKIPSFLKEAFGNGQDYLGIDTGKKIRDWLNKGKKDSPEILKLKSEFLMVAEQGVKALEQLWNTLSKENKMVLKDHVNICKESALAYDNQGMESEFESDDEKFNLLTNLRSKTLKNLSAQEEFDVDRIIKEKEVSSYDKAIKFLTLKQTKPDFIYDSTKK
jgi:hypothetical protein